MLGETHSAVPPLTNDAHSLELPRVEARQPVVTSGRRASPMLLRGTGRRDGHQHSSSGGAGVCSRCGALADINVRTGAPRPLHDRAAARRSIALHTAGR